MKKFSMVAVAAVMAAVTFSSKADERSWSWSPLGIGIAAPIQLPFMSSDVYGIRLGGLIGYNRNVYGLDAGLLEVAEGDFAGIQGSGFSWTVESAYGIQAAFLANVVGDKTVAIQAAFANVTLGEAAGLQAAVVNYSPVFSGLQFGAVNYVESEQFGLSAAAFNFLRGESCGLEIAGVNFGGKVVGAQLGFINVADEVTGVQIGGINATEKMHGLQLGFINLICRSALPVMVVANATF